MQVPATSRLLIVALLLTACGGGGDGGPNPGDPLTVASVQPLDGATDVATGVSLAATFDRALDVATLTPTSFVVRRDGTPLAGAVSYDAGTRTARRTAPLLPGTAYDVELTTALADAEGTSLAAVKRWRFTARAWQGVRLDPSPSTGRFNALAIEPAGRLHLTYYDQTSGDLKYALCAADCANAGSWQATAVDEAGTVGHASSVVVGSDGKVHVSYMTSGNQAPAVKYATCAATCTNNANWQAIVIDALGEVFLGTSLRIDQAGRLHLVYPTFDGLKYATCTANCTATANWQLVTIDVDPGSNTPDQPSLVIDGTGRLHVAYENRSAGDLKYATCGAACATAASWQVIAVDQPGDVGRQASLGIDPTTGRLHVIQRDLDNDNLKYSTCAAGCTAPAAWQTIAIDETGEVGRDPSLAVDPLGRLHVVYGDETAVAIKYATCAAGCETAANWQRLSVTQVAVAEMHTALAIDAGGRPHTVYFDGTGPRHME